MANSKIFKKLLFGLVKQVKLDMEKQFAKAELEITPFQYGILYMLKNKSYNLNELSEKLGVKPPSLVPPVEMLSKLGYLMRKQDKQDHRKIHLMITPKAKKIFKKIHHPADKLSKAFHKLTSSNQGKLIELLGELNSQFK